MMGEADLSHLRSRQEEQSEPFWLLGESYDAKRLGAKRLHIQTIFKCTYRSGFPAIEPYRITDDAGWGCMLRSAQMLMANTWIRQLLGRDWRRPASLEQIRRSSLYSDIFRWFCDYAGYPCLYSIHHMLQSGMRYDKLPGEWYGPGTAALVLRDLARCHRKKYGGRLEVYVGQGRTLYVTEMLQLCRREQTVGSESNDGLASDEGDETKDDEAQQACRTASQPHNKQESEGQMYDPLFNPPPQALRSFDYGLLILIPLRLGLKDVNPEYLPGLKWCLRCRYSVGILGGRPNHAIYFVGYQGAHLFGHDPHTVWANPPLDGAFPSTEYVQQASVNELVSMKISQLDPSIALAFYVKDEAEFDDFLQLAKSPEQDLFAVDHHPPSFDGLHGSDNFCMDDAVPYSGDQEDDEYVFV